MIFDLGFYNKKYQLNFKDKKEALEHYETYGKLQGYLTYDSNFSKEFYAKTYFGKDFKSYEQAYSDWVVNRDKGYLGYPLKDRQGFIYTSQIGQDYYVINEVFKRAQNLFFVEIGAGDGVFLSNTYVLEKYFGWKGIGIEPNARDFRKLKKNRNCLVDNSLLYSANDREVLFMIHRRRSELSGIKDNLNTFLDERRKAIKMKTKTLEYVLDKYSCPSLIDYLSIDTEGSEYEILKNFPFNKKYFVRYISVEYGYDPALKDKLSEFFCKNNYLLRRENLWDAEYILKDFDKYTT